MNFSDQPPSNVGEINVVHSQPEHLWVNWVFNIVINILKLDQLLSTTIVMITWITEKFKTSNPWEFLFAGDLAPVAEEEEEEVR